MFKLFFLTTAILLSFVACNNENSGKENVEQKENNPTNGLATEYDTTQAKDTMVNFPVKRPEQNMLPALKDGRYQIPVKKLAGTDLWITLPGNFAISPDVAGDGTGYYVFDKNDPSLKDKGATVEAFMRLYVTPKSPNGFAGQADSTVEKTIIAGQPLEWKIWEEKSPNGDVFYLRELKSLDFFAGISPEQAQKHIALYIYMGGTKKEKITELVKAASTISIKP